MNLNPAFDQPQRTQRTQRKLVFVAGLLCVLLKLGDVTRFQIEGGMYWFFAAVILSLVNAHWTEKTLRASAVGK